MTNAISEVTRLTIFDYFVASNTNWSGRLSDNDFLGRLYDLTKMPSYDLRFKDAAGDIWQHTTNNSDWDAEWVFSDSRFNLRGCSDDEFLRFLCESLHPVVRSDTNNARALATELNRLLAADGWKLIEQSEISGHPVFAAQTVGGSAKVFTEPTGWQKVDRQLQGVRHRLDTATSEEQFQTVGLLCREVLISLCETAFDLKKHRPVDGVAPSTTDAKRMLECIFEAELRSSPTEEARSHAKAALRLALALQHRRTADFRMAALCAEATDAVVNLVAIVVGRRGRGVVMS